MVDEVKDLSIKEMESQMSDTTDLVTKVNLAPPTRRFMQWEETGGAKELFGLPGRPIPARSLFRVRKKFHVIIFLLVLMDAHVILILCNLGLSTPFDEPTN